MVNPKTPKNSHKEQKSEESVQSNIFPQKFIYLIRTGRVVRLVRLIRLVKVYKKIKDKQKEEDDNVKKNKINDHQS